MRKRTWTDPRDGREREVWAVARAEVDNPTFGEPITRIEFRLRGEAPYGLNVTGHVDLSSVQDADLQDWLDEARG